MKIKILLVIILFTCLTTFGTIYVGINQIGINKILGELTDNISVLVKQYIKDIPKNGYLEKLSVKDKESGFELRMKLKDNIDTKVQGSLFQVEQGPTITVDVSEKKNKNLNFNFEGENCFSVSFSPYLIKVRVPSINVILFTDS